MSGSGSVCYVAAQFNTVNNTVGNAHMLVDSGASTSAIGENAYKSMFSHIPLKHHKVIVKGYSGGQVTSLGSVELSFSLHGHDFSHSFLVVPNTVSQQWLLGMDFLVNSCIDLGESTMRINDANGVRVNIPLVTQSKFLRDRKISVNQTVSLPPKTLSLVPCHLAEFGPKGGIPTYMAGMTGMTVRNPSLFNKKGVTSANSVITVHDNAQVVVAVLNPLDQPVKLHHGQTVSYFQPDCEVLNFDLDLQPKVIPKCEPKLPEGISLDGTCLNHEEQLQLKALISEYHDCFASSLDEIGTVKGFEFHLDTGSHPPIAQKPYRQNPIQKAITEQHLAQMEKAGVIKEGESPWASPICLSLKKDKTWRVCYDYRALNAITKIDSAPIPRTDDLLEAAGGATIYTTLDLKSGYNNVPMDKESQMKAAIVSHEKSYHVLKMGFGLSNSPAQFSKLMNTVLKGLSPKICLIFIDDILVPSRSTSEHFRSLRQIFDRLREYNLKLNAKKCIWAREKVIFLGNLVSAKGIECDPAKLKVISEYPSPEQSRSPVKATRSFLGLCSYYRRFIQSFAQIAAPLYDLLKKNQPFKWSDACQKAFQDLKSKLLSPPILGYPDWSRDFILQTDSSDLALGAVLSQTDNEGAEHPIGYAGRSLKKGELNYKIYEKELLALFFGLDHFSSYLIGTNVTVYTDNRALSFLLKSSKASKSAASQRLARWAMKLSSYPNVTLKHRGSNHMGNCDAISRFVFDPSLDSQSIDDDPLNDYGQEVIYVTTRSSARGSGDGQTDGQTDHGQSDQVNDLPKEVSKSADQIVDQSDILGLQKVDPEWRDLVAYINKGILPTSKSKAAKVIRESPLYEMHKGVLCRIRVAKKRAPGTVYYQICLPKVLQWPMIERLHSDLSCSGFHGGRDKTYQSLICSYYFKRASRMVRAYVRQCHLCQVRKGRKQEVPMKEMPVAKYPLDRICLDIAGPLVPSGPEQYKYFALITDSFSKYIEVYPLIDTKSKTIATALWDFISREGVPCHLLTDNAANMTSEMMRELCSMFKCEALTTSSYSPQSDSSERYIGLFKQVLSMYCNQHSDWKEWIRNVVFAINTSISSVHNFTPFELFKGRQALTNDKVSFGLNQEEISDPANYVQKLSRKMYEAFNVVKESLGLESKRNKHFFDKRRGKKKLHKVGDLVYLHIGAKADSSQIGGQSKSLKKNRWEGPYKVIEAWGSNCRLLEYPTMKPYPRVVHQSRLKKGYVFADIVGKSSSDLNRKWKKSQEVSVEKGPILNNTSRKNSQGVARNRPQGKCQGVAGKGPKENVAGKGPQENKVKLDDSDLPTNYYYVDRLLKSYYHRKLHTRVYLVKWQNFDKPSWEVAESIPLAMRNKYHEDQ